jgi:hypothetical protein
MRQIAGLTAEVRRDAAALRVAGRDRGQDRVVKAEIVQRVPPTTVLTFTAMAGSPTSQNSAAN